MGGDTGDEASTSAPVSVVLRAANADGGECDADDGAGKFECDSVGDGEGIDGERRADGDGHVLHGGNLDCDGNA